MSGISVFGWTTAAARRWSRQRRRDEGFGADVFGDELGMLAQSVAGALDLDDDGVMQEPIELLLSLGFLLFVAANWYRCARGRRVGSKAPESGSLSGAGPEGDA